MTFLSRLNAALAAVTLMLSVLSSPALARETIEQAFDLSGFTRIDLEGSSYLEIVQGESFSVVASGKPEAVALARAEVRGDTLKLWVEPNHKRFFGFITVSNGQSVKYRVSLPAIDAVAVTGSGEATAETLESESLVLAVTGSGDLRVAKVAAESLQASVTGSGDLALGTVLSVRGEMAIRGSGDLSFESFAGEMLEADIKGSGDIVVNGRVGTVRVNIMGSGDFLGRNLQADRGEGAVMGSGDIVLRRPGSDSFSVMGSGDIALVD
ncbi:GIN domain-containing protein [Microbulbifer guangxiensis]|uniref:GIN domain-containing protein n=1 Tax=Microbulbifer guangxiensis TaxID=2904249 RepID=UPI001F23D018|nr:DUF2807 domain-containing protein [Microbulbifer guangxiensis]